MLNRKPLAKAAVLAAAGLCLTLLVTHAPGGGAAKPAKENLNLISLEVLALQALDTLELTPKQLAALAEMAKETRENPRKRQPAKVSAQYRQLLLDLHAALVKQDDEKVNDLDAKLEELAASENPELDTDVEVTEAARKRAPELTKMLTPAQVTAFLGTLTVGEPLEILSEALEEGRDQKKQEWTQTRDEAADEVAHLLGGLNDKKTAEISTKVKTLLDKAHAAKETKVTEELEQLVTKAGPFVVLRTTVEHGLAELLSNPRLPAAVESRKNAAK